MKRDVPSKKRLQYRRGGFRRTTLRGRTSRVAFYEGARRAVKIEYLPRVSQALRWRARSRSRGETDPREPVPSDTNGVKAITVYGVAGDAAGEIMTGALYRRAGATGAPT